MYAIRVNNRSPTGYVMLVDAKEGEAIEVIPGAFRSDKLPPSTAMIDHNMTDPVMEALRKARCLTPLLRHNGTRKETEIADEAQRLIDEILKIRVVQKKISVFCSMDDFPGLDQPIHCIVPDIEGRALN